MGRGAALSGKRPRPVGCGLFAREGGAPLSMLLLRSESLQNLLKRTKEAAAAYIDTTDSPKLKGLTVAQLFGLEWKSAPREQLNWRSRMNALFKGFDQYGIGLLITVDEVSASLDEMISFAATYQLFVREGKRVGLLMAGLPHQVSALLRNQTVSFLRRSVQHRLSGVADQEVAQALVQGHCKRRGGWRPEKRLTSWSMLSVAFPL